MKVAPKPDRLSRTAAVLAWLRGDRHRPADDRRSVLPTTGMGGLGDKETAAALRELRWRRSYETGHPIIDQQHSALFDLANKLIHAVHSEKHRIDIELLLDEFVAHIKEHFATEEEVLARTGFPLSERHKEVHHALLARARELRKWYGAGRLAASELVGFIADDVIADHILKEDSKFALNDR